MLAQIFCHQARMCTLWRSWFDLSMVLGLVFTLRRFGSRTALERALTHDPVKQRARELGERLAEA